MLRIQYQHLIPYLFEKLQHRGEQNIYGHRIFCEPELREYLVAAGQPAIKRLRVPVRHPDHKSPEYPGGYVPLPEKYLGPWKHLCFQIAFLEKCFDMMEKSTDKSHYALELTALQQWIDIIEALHRLYRYCRALIIHELLAQRGRANMELPLFDEYIIKAQNGLLWRDPKDEKYSALPGVSFLEFTDHSTISELSIRMIVFVCPEVTTY